MKRIRKLLVLLLVLTCVLAEMIPLTGYAESERTYEVRIYAGNKGSIDDGSVYIVSGLPYDASTFYGMPSVTPAAGYYVKGLKESGSELIMTSYNVTRDQDYVVAYGISGTEVKYTVQYLLYGSNTKLAADGTFYAGEGDRPVSSYIYIDGYQPYRRTTRILVADESQNVLYCYYTRIGATTTTTTTTTGAAAAAGGAAVANAGGAAAGNAGVAAAGVNAGAGANAGAGVEAAGNTTQAGTNPTPIQEYATTDDIMDLDVPLAMPETAGGASLIPSAPPAIVEPSTHDRLPTWALVASGVVLFGLIALLYWYLLYYRKKVRYEQAISEQDLKGFDDLE